MSKILLIIPCYNEEKSIVSVINQIRKYSCMDYIVVNDGSTDETESILKQNKIAHVTHLVNCGLATAFCTGIRYALNSEIEYDAVCQIDADGQHNIQYIKDMVKILEQGEDIVIGSRYVDSNVKEKSILKRWSRKLISFCIKIHTGKYIADPTSGMRMYSKRVYEMFEKDYNLKPEPDGLVYFLKHGYSVKEMMVKMNEREYGESYLTVGTSIKYMINIIGSIVLFQWWRK